MNFTENEFGNSNNTNNGVNTTPTNNYNPPVGTITQSNSFTPQPVNNYDSNGFKQPSNNFVNNENIKKIVIGVIAVAVVVGGFFGIKSLFGGNSTAINSESLTSSSAFAIKNSAGKYALFNNDGTKLTDFTYKYVSSFFNGTAIVTQGDNSYKYGVISQSGKMIIPVGKYASIDEIGGLYKLADKNYDHVLANSTGKIVSDLKTEELASYFDDYYVMLENANSYIFMNYNGTRFLTIGKNKSITSEPVTKETDGLLTVFYNGKNYIYNAITGKKIIEFTDSSQYCIDGQNEKNPNEIILQNCTGSTYHNDSEDYKYVANGSIKFETKKGCSNLYFEDGSILCNYYDSTDRESKLRIYDENGNKTAAAGWYKFSFNSFNSFVKTADNGEGVEFYENGKLAKTVDCFKVYNKSYSSKKIYTLFFDPSSTCTSSSEEYYQYFKSNGELLRDDKYEGAAPYDINGLSQTRKIINRVPFYTLIDLSGKAVIDGYNNITNAAFTNGGSEYYIVNYKDSDTLINAKGEKLISAKEIPTYKKVNNIIYFVINKNDKESTIYNSKTKKEVVTINKDFEWNDNYIKVTNGTKTEYYTYTGKLFYTN